MRLGYDDIKASSLSDIKAFDFETLVTDLVRWEIRARHLDADVDRPGPQATADGGHDLFVRIRHAPGATARAAFHPSLLGDFMGDTYVSCKSGAHWEQDVLSDLKEQSRPLDLLAKGARFILVVNREDAQRDSFERGRPSKVRAKKVTATTKSKPSPAKAPAPPKPLREQIVDLVKKLHPNVPTTVADRIELIGAGHLCEFLMAHRPGIRPPFRRALGLTDAPELLELAAWEEKQSYDRSPPEFIADASRKAVIEQLRMVLANPPEDAKQRVLWLHGRPGIGKSRLVLEALRGLADAPARVAIADSGPQARVTLRQHEPYACCSDLIVVADDCSAETVGDLAQTFYSQARDTRGCLVCIGPPSAEARRDPEWLNEIDLARLPDEEAQQLIGELLSSSALADTEGRRRILSLAEGYPYYLVLLTRAMSEEPDATPALWTRWQAARRVLARLSDFATEVDRDAAADRRARALLAVLLTEDRDWGHLSAQRQGDLAAAVGLPSFASLERSFAECGKQGLIRESADRRFKYVTPDILAREVLIELLGGPGGGPSLRRYTPEWANNLFNRLDYFQVPADIQGRIALLLAEELETQPKALDTLLRAGEALSFLARHQPAWTARWLRTIVESTPIAELRSRHDARRAPIWALARLARRQSAFEDAEAALFRMALAENEAYRNNATGVWKDLFLVALNPTRRPFEARLRLLARRLGDPPLEAQRLALAGLEVALEPRETIDHLGDEDLDGGPLRPTNDIEASAQRSSAWNLIIESAADESNPLAEHARLAAIKYLRPAIWIGLGGPVMQQMATTVRSWDSDSKRKLQQAIDEVEAFDRQSMRDDVDASEALAKIKREIAARSYLELLKDGVGNWQPWVGKAEVEDSESFEHDLDARLAQLGLQADAPLLDDAAIEWLDSREAVRTIPFARQVGIFDSDGLMLPKLVARAASGRARNPMLLPAYVGGVQSRGAGGEVDKLLASWAAHPTMRLSWLYSIWHAGPTDDRVHSIVRALRTGEIEPSRVGCLTTGAWDRDLTPGARRELVEELAAHGDTTAQATALDLILHRLRPPTPWNLPPTTEDEKSSLLPFIPRLVEMLSAVPDANGTIAYAWKKGCRTLIDEGHDQEAVKAATSVLRSSRRMGADDHAWEILLALTDKKPGLVWRAFAMLLEEDEEGRAHQMMLEARYRNLLSRIPADEVLAWVGREEGRAELVARACSVHESPLDALARALLDRFGPAGDVASALAAQAQSTPRVIVGGLSAFFRQQLSHARDWSNDSSAAVAAFGRSLVPRLEKEVAYHESEEEHRRRRQRA